MSVFIVIPPCSFQSMKPDVPEFLRFEPNPEVTSLYCNCTSLIPSAMSCAFHFLLVGLRYARDFVIELSLSPIEQLRNSLWMTGHIFLSNIRKSMSVVPFDFTEADKGRVFFNSLTNIGQDTA